MRESIEIESLKFDFIHPSEIWTKPEALRPSVLPPIVSLLCNKIGKKDEYRDFI